MTARHETLHVDDGGVGEPPVIFLHSLAGNASQWAAQLAHLRPHRRALALDLRGHGRSGPPADGLFGIGAYAGDVIATLDELGLNRFVLVGHSMGASVAAAVADADPRRVAGLLLVDGAFAREEPTREERRWLRELGTHRYAGLIEGHWSAVLEGAPAEVRERVMTDLRRTDPHTVVASYRALIDDDPIPALRRYRRPKMVVLSDVGDNPAAPHHHVHGLRHALIRGTGHWVQMDRPDEVNAFLDDFLARIRGAAARS